MKQYSIEKKALTVLVCLLLFICINGIVFQLDIKYSLWWYIGTSLFFVLLFINIYHVWFAGSIQKLTDLNQKILGQAFTNQSDELEQVSITIKKLLSEKEKAIDFIKAIGEGDFESDHTEHALDYGEKDALTEALLNMRNQLKEMAKKEKERSWVSEKLASFSEIIRSNSKSLPELCHNVVSNLVKYINANQAAIFILNDQDEQAPFLEMMACYAYDRRKYLEKKISVGEGLLGQTFLEKQPLYITDIPQNYTLIRSGLGDSTPNCLLILPIMQNDDVFGVLEIASFKELEAYQIEFIEKMSEGMAAAISTTKISEQTFKLLEESQTQTQILIAQEEEMRQNMEEIQATEEANARIQRELRANEQKQLEKIEELQKARLTLLEKEEMLKASQEKAQKRSLKFKEKMEQLDMEIEGKNAQIKRLMNQIEGIKKKHNLTDEEILSFK